MCARMPPTETQAPVQKGEPTDFMYYPDLFFHYLDYPDDQSNRRPHGAINKSACFRDTIPQGSSIFTIPHPFLMHEEWCALLVNSSGTTQLDVRKPGDCYFENLVRQKLTEGTEVSSNSMKQLKVDKDSTTIANEIKNVA